MIAASMAAASMIAAGMALSVLMVMMITPGVGIIIQAIIDKSGHSKVCAALYATVELDTGLGKGGLGAAANAAADQCIDLQLGQHAGERAVAAALGIYDHAPGNFSIFDIIDLKSAGVTKMLENQAVFISNCNSHMISSLKIVGLMMLGMSWAMAAFAMAGGTITQLIITAFDGNAASFYEGFSQLFPGRGIDLLNGCSGHAHLPAALFLGIIFKINQTDRFVFIN